MVGMRINRRSLWGILFAAPIALVAPRKSRSILDAEFNQRYLEALYWPRDEVREEYIVNGVVPVGGKPKPMIPPQRYITICNPDGSVELIPITLPPKVVAHRDGGHTFYRMDYGA